MVSSTGAAVTELTAPSRSVASRRMEDMVGFIQDVSLLFLEITQDRGAS